MNLNIVVADFEIYAILWGMLTIVEGKDPRCYLCLSPTVSTAKTHKKQ